MSELDIINSALAHLGADHLEDSPDTETPTRQLRVARALLPTLRDAWLRKHPWLCATFYRTLSPEAAPVTDVWRAAFPVPAETLRLFLAGTCRTYEFGSAAILDGSGALAGYRKVVFTNDLSTALTVKTIERVDYDLFDASLADAMGYELAARMAGPLNAAPELAAELRKIAASALIEAMSLDTSELGNEPAPFGESVWLEARAGATYGWDAETVPLLSPAGQHGTF